MQVKRVKDLMIPLERYPYVQDNATIKEAIEVAMKAGAIVEGTRHSARYILVFDKLNVLVGYLRRRDILRGLEPPSFDNHPLEYRKKLFDVEFDPNLTLLNYDKLIETVKAQASRRVIEVIRPIKMWIKANDNFLTAIYEMVENDISLLPVVSEDQVTGVILSENVFEEMAHTLLEESEA